MSEPDEHPTDDTRPLGPSPPYPPPYPSGWQSPMPQRPGPPYAGPPYAGPPYAAGPSGPYARPPVRRTGGPPGWLWPVVAATALVVGLLGGVIGGVVVSTSLDSGLGAVSVVGAGNGAAPLKVDNGSISAVAAKLLPSTVQVNANGGALGSQNGGATGSGFVLDRHGHVITNNHVVAAATGAGQLQVVDSGGHAHAARIVGRSPVYDIAVLEVQGGSDLRPAPLGSSHSLRVGDTVVAIGSPLGLSSTVTSGIVSALDRPVTANGESTESSFIDAVQTDAAINPGNSGGPLVNMRGQVIGVNSAIATTGGDITGQAGNIGVGFAIPMEQVQITSAQILATGQARYPVIGANVDTGSTHRGAQVVRVPAGTPAAHAGLRRGDVVVAVNGKPVTDGIGLIVAIRAHRPGETITLSVERDGSRKRVKVTLDGKVG